MNNIGPDMKQRFNPNHLTPGDKLNTLAGPAEYIQHKPDNFRGQNHQVKLQHNQQTRWYTADQLREANSAETESSTIIP